MKTIASASVSSAASPADFLARWADVATWPDWNSDTEWVRLDGPFVEGATGTLKPKGGPKVRFVIARLVPGVAFVDVSRLWGAQLVFDHRVAVRPDGVTEVSVTITMSGPLAAVWTAILGKDLRASVQRDLDALARAAEAAPQAV